MKSPEERELNFERDIEIDPLALDVEWVRQGKIFFRYAKQMAEARQEVDRLKERLDVLEAKLKKDIRSAPERWGISRVSENAISETLSIMPERRAMAKELAEAQLEYEILVSAVRALDQKKTALENLVRLQGQNYFAGPSAPRDIGREVAKGYERAGARSLVKNAMKKNRDK